MKNFLLFILCLFQFPLFAQNIAGVVNSYTAVTAVNQNVFSVTSTTQFNVGDKVMVIKMKGATVNQSNSPSYGDTLATNDAGKYVFSFVLAKTGNTLTLSPYCTTFADDDYLQIVRIPIFNNAVVTAPITCPSYDGFVGGIIAFEAQTVTMQANIDATARGYRGGDVWGAQSTCGATNFFSAAVAFGPEGKKGEGIADWIPGQECGKGKLANGGGGSYSGNTGAGGGGNYGRGGHGGWENSVCATANVFSYGAQAVSHHPTRFFMGGGGGGPQADSSQVYNGGSGGGIIYIRANEIIGNGFSILSNGGTTPIIADEGAAGGGAGGSIYLNVDLFTTAINVRANGGAGGSNNNILLPFDCHGPGGGGGGGLIHLSLSGIPFGMITELAGGNPGVVLNPASACYNTSYNAQLGEPGNVEFNFSLPVLPPPPAFTLGPDKVLCNGLNVTLDAGAGNQSFLWDDGSTAQTRIVNTPGTYFVTVFTNSNCTSSDTINVLADTSIHANFNIIKRLGCEEDTIELVNTSTGATNYLWFFGDSQSSLLDNPIHIYYNQMAYNVTLIAFNGLCSDTLLQTVDVSHPLIADMYVYSNAGAILVDSTCIYNDLNAQSLSVPVGLTQNTFYWGDGDSTVNGYNTFASHLYAAGGNYTLTLVVTDTLGCHDTISEPVFVDAAAYGDFTVSDSVACVGDPIIFYDTISPFTTSFVYDFGDQSIVRDIENPVHSFDIGNNYIVTLTVSNLICPDTTISKNVIIDDYPNMNLGPDTTICPGITGTIILSNLINPAGVYEWSTGDITNNISITESGHYWVKGVSPNAGCVTVDSIYVERDCYINIPNAFSPDGDGLNDYFFPKDIQGSGITSFRMNIFNRWGEMVFSTTSIDGRGWDGKFNAKPQPMGVYVYMMDVVFSNKIKKTFQGNVTLVR